MYLLHSSSEIHTTLSHLKLFSNICPVIHHFLYCLNNKGLYREEKMKTKLKLGYTKGFYLEISWKN